MDVYIASDGDGIGTQVGRAALANNEEELTRLSGAIKRANQQIVSFVLSAGGRMISEGGDEANAVVPADKLVELQALRQIWREEAGATLSVGVGKTLAEAGRSLMAAKLRGKDQVVLYSPEVEAEIAELERGFDEEPTADDERQKIAEGYFKGELEPMADINGVSEYLVGGFADGHSADEFDADELKKGIEVEAEHTNNPKIAEEIARDHLAEIPDYYTRLAKMEDQAKKDGKYRKVTKGKPGEASRIEGDGSKMSKEEPDYVIEEEDQILIDDLRARIQAAMQAAQADTAIEGQGPAGGLPSDVPPEGAPPGGPPPGVVPPEVAAGMGEAPPPQGEAPPPQGEAPPPEGDPGMAPQGEAPPPEGDPGMAPQGEAPPPEGDPGMAPQGEAPPQEGEAPPQEGEAPPAGDGDVKARLRNLIGETLVQVQQSAPVLEQLQQQDPGAYQAVVGVVGAMLDMAQFVLGGQGEAPPDEQQAPPEDVPPEGAPPGGPPPGMAPPGVGGPPV